MHVRTSSVVPNTMSTAGTSVKVHSRLGASFCTCSEVLARNVISCKAHRFVGEEDSIPCAAILLQHVALCLIS